MPCRPAAPCSARRTGARWRRPTTRTCCSRAAPAPAAWSARRSRFSRESAIRSEVGVQQGLGRWVVVDVGYFVKRTDNAYDFGVLYDTPIVFPISWDHSRIDGFTGRINLVEHHGFSAFTVFGHTNAIFSPPGNGGILLEAAAGRLPHRPRSEVPADHQPAVRLQPDGGRVGGVQLAVRLGAGGRFGARLRDGVDAHGRSAGRHRPLLRQHRRDASMRQLRACSSSNRGATRLNIPADGTEDDVNNPARIAPRHLFDLGARGRQPVSVETVQSARPLQRRQPDQQGGALQFSVDVHRHALRDAARPPGSSSA